MEIHRFLPDTAVFDPVLSAYKSDEEDFLWIGGPNPCGFLPVEVSFSFSWNSILFILCFWAEVQSHFLPKGQEF